MTQSRKRKWLWFTLTSLPSPTPWCFFFLDLPKVNLAWGAFGTLVNSSNDSTHHSSTVYWSPGPVNSKQPGNGLVFKTVALSCLFLPLLPTNPVMPLYSQYTPAPLLAGCKKLICCMSLQISCACLRISCKWNNIKCNLLSLSSFSQHLPMVLCVSVYCSFLLWSNPIVWPYDNLVYSLPCWWTFWVVGGLGLWQTKMSWTLGVKYFCWHIFLILTTLMGMRWF